TVAVEDTGHGIEPEHLPHLFERFYRTDWARAKDSGGTGLGLPIVKEIAEAHGGAISVTSHVGKGSVFTLRLPVPTYQTIPV
ncbi:MAG: sensor histidine kinase, partial [Nitrospiraceae bacterium]